MGTHLVENMIGVARSLSNDSRFERIVSAFANSDMKQQMTQKMGLKIHTMHEDIFNSMHRI